MKKTATMYKPSAKSNSKKLLKPGSMVKGWVGFGWVGLREGTRFESQ